ncbi:unnamed protein product [Malus baccata var. baccata]
MAADNRTIKELSASGLDNAAPLCIQYPRAAPDKTAEFELKSSLLHHIPKYHGLSMEDPNKHLKEFEVVCSSMTPVNVDESILKMKAFPFSLQEKAKDWLYELAPGTVTSWESMKRAYLEKFFPTSRVILLRKRISGIQQDEGESFPTYYERFKSLVTSCPQHQMKEELLIQNFYEGLLPIERQMLDTSAGGALVDKTLTAAKMLIANRALNAQQYEGVGQRSMPRQHQVNEVSAITELQNQMANLTTLLSQVVEGPKVKTVASCGVCSMQGHPTDKCPQLIENGGWETLNAVGYGNQYQSRGDPFSNTYNPGKQQSGLRQQPPGFYQKPLAPPQAQAQPAQSNEVQTQNKERQIQDKRLDELEKQVGQIAEFMGQFREQGKLPSSTVVNPRGGVETAKAIMLRSGKEVGTEPKPSKAALKEDKKLQIEEEEQAKATARIEQSLPQPPKHSNSANKDVPFPSRFLQAKNEEEEKDVLETFRKVDHLIFPTDFYVLDMEDSTHSPPSPLLLGRPFMKTAQTKIDVAKGAVTMAFGGDMINFKISESVENTNDVRSCCAINECSTLVKKNVPQPTIEEGIGVNNKECTPCAYVPNRRQRGGRVRVDLEKQNMTIRKDHYPIPFKDPKNEEFRRTGCGKTTPCRGGTFQHNDEDSVLRANLGFKTLSFAT